MKKIVLLFNLLFLLGSQVLVTAETPKFQLRSSVFANQGNIPALYSRTRKGKNITPPLYWNNAPKNTKSFALIVEDRLVGNLAFAHWVLYNIPADQTELPEAIHQQKRIVNGVVQAKNGYGKMGYVGPHPAWGTHHYYFTIYALDTKIRSNSKMNRSKLLKAMRGHILSQAQLVGCYSAQWQFKLLFWQQSVKH